MGSRGVTLLLAALLVALAACGSRAGTDRLTETERPGAGSSAQLEENLEKPGTSEAENTSGELATTPRVIVTFQEDKKQFEDEDGALLLTVDLGQAGVMIAGKPDASEAINQALEQCFGGNSAGMERYLKLAQDSRKESEDFQSFVCSRELKTGRVDGAVLSLICKDLAQTGGPHPNWAASAVNFDVETGAELTLADLGPDEAALRQRVGRNLQMQVQQAAAAGQYYDDAEEQALELLDERLWYFSEDGLTVICNPYLIATHAAGIQWFTVPYDDLDGVLDPKWLPQKQETRPDGAMELSVGRGEAEVRAISLDEPGERLCLTARSPVDAVRLVQVSSADGVTWEIQKEHLYVSWLQTGESIAVIASIPDTMPNFAVAWQGQNGMWNFYGICQSGKDGSVFLMPLESVT